MTRTTRILFRDAAITSGTVALAIVLVAILSGVLFSPYDPIAINTAEALSAPSLHHPFGTDELGRDLWTRFADGGVTSLGLAAAIVAISGLVGLVIGTTAGYVGRALDGVVMRVSDALQAFPSLLLAMLVAYALGRGTVPIIVALSVSYVPYFVKIARGATLKHRDSLVVRAARTSGARTPRIVRTHVIPHVFPVVFTQMTMAFGSALLAIAGLSVIGLGAPQPAPEWGAMLAASTPYAFQAWWYTVIPGFLITLSAFGFTFLGESIRSELGLAPAAPSAVARLPRTLRRRRGGAGSASGPDGRSGVDARAEQGHQA